MAKKMRPLTAALLTVFSILVLIPLGFYLFLLCIVDLWDSSADAYCFWLGL